MEAAPGIAGGQGQINAVGKLSLLLKRKSVGVLSWREQSCFLGIVEAREQIPLGHLGLQSLEQGAWTSTPLPIHF